MARRANYGFEKRQREIRKQKKKEEKAARKRETRDALQELEGSSEESPDTTDADGQEVDPAEP